MPTFISSVVLIIVRPNIFLVSDIGDTPQKPMVVSKTVKSWIEVKPQHYMPLFTNSLCVFGNNE